jgi:hypothetical protein
MALAFVPRRDTHFYLLARHRQPLPENIAAQFVEQFTVPNDLVVDPFAASDALIRAALERGRRVLASESNPIVAWAARVQATLPNARDINAALARLGDTRKEGDTLKAATEKLYTSRCAQCSESVTAEYFIWRRDGGKALLAEKIYTCPNCGARRDDATEADRQKAQAAEARSLSYHLLVQKLLADDPANTPHLKRLLELYTPRNLNALAGITQKLDAEFRDSASAQADLTRNVLSALLLHALDVGSSLYSSPGAMPTRNLPDEFIEVNVWRALEEAARGLSERPAALRLAKPAQVVASSAPAAFIGQGGARFLDDNAPGAQAALILSSPARLDPIFWELSFLWTRWLLGKQAAAPLEPLLDPKRQRWGWYGDALIKSIADAARLLRPGAPAVVAFPSGSHAMIQALMLAASPVFELNEFAFRPERGADRATEWGALRGDYQVVWKRVAELPDELPGGAAPATKIRASALQGARSILEERGEPLAYSWLHHAALENLARDGTLVQALGANYREGDNAFQNVRHRMEEGLKEGYIQEIDHWEEPGRVLWMRRDPGGEPKTEESLTLTDRVETAVRALLETRQTIAVMELEDLILARFGGLLTPELELVEICARAYADLMDEAWVWRNADTKGELENARRLTEQLAQRLAVQVVPSPERFDLVWRTERVIPGSASGSVRQERIYEDEYAFLFRERVDWRELLTLRAAPLRGLLVIPESRVELTRERLRRDPRLVKHLERAGWDFLRLPMLESLLSGEYRTHPEFQLAWGLDPPLAQGQEQLQLL